MTDDDIIKVVGTRVIDTIQSWGYKLDAAQITEILSGIASAIYLVRKEKENPK